MPTRREEILLAVQARLSADPFFPPPALDAPEPDDWVDIPGAAAPIKHHCSVQDGPVEVTRDGGAEDDWELELELTIAYAVQGDDPGARRARRDQAAARITALIRADRRLGLDDPQIYAEISGATRDDNVPVKSGAIVAVLLVTVCVQYVAASAAG